jgi:hypothetical protein
MNATTPLQIDGKTYPKFSLNLAITGKYSGDGSSDANVAMRLIPTRVENGEVITADDFYNPLHGTIFAVVMAAEVLTSAIRSRLI